MKISIDLDQHIRILKRILTAAAVKFAKENNKKIEDVVTVILDGVFGNSLIDSELVESIVISLSIELGLTAKNPQCEINGGYEGKGEEKHCDHENYCVIAEDFPKIHHCNDCGDNFFVVATD